MKLRILLFGALISLSSLSIFAQLSAGINPDILNKEWSSKWITYPGISGEEFGVYLFRKDINLDSKPTSFIIHVSADNRYKLYVNGTQVCNGPARGDLAKWYFETVDIAPYLKVGQNVLTSEVWNFAKFRPAAQITNLTGFILQGNNQAESVVNTDKSWLVYQDSAYSPCVKIFLFTGPGEAFNAALHPWNWMQANFDNSNWIKARELENGRPTNSFAAFGAQSPYILHPREIPALEEKMQRFFSIRRSGLPKISESFLKGEKSLTIPPHTKTKILIDQKNLTNAYPVLIFSKGKKSEIKITYSECMYDENQEKGNRDVIDKKTISGSQDLVLPDGGDNRTFKSLWFRTFRYVELEIETKDEALEINDFYSVFTGYPFEEKASFKCDVPLMTTIWNVGWRTQRLCAMETFMDCPYYEQLQYVGDARIQALLSTYVTGDTRLMKTAISSIHESRLPSGLTQSRYPCNSLQVIPPFSLIWNTMVYDYWMLKDDKKLVRSMIPGMMDVLNWYEANLDSTGMLGPMEYWNFMDQVTFKGWDFAMPPGQLNGQKTSVISLLYVYALEKTAKVLEAFGMKEEASRYSILAENIKTSVYKNCWDTTKGLIADTPAKDIFSQHANVLAILTNTIPLEDQRVVVTRIWNNQNIAPYSLYFGFYMTEALEKTGMADQYLDMLDPWKKMLDAGLTTFAEVPDPTRSDCHAWSSSPVYYFLSLVCGIKPAEPGFKTILIKPHLGSLKWIEGSMPHPLGTIMIRLKKDKQNHLSGSVSLPERLSGTFISNGQHISLKGGLNLIH